VAQGLGSRVQGFCVVAQGLAADISSVGKVNAASSNVLLSVSLFGVLLFCFFFQCLAEHTRTESATSPPFAAHTGRAKPMHGLGQDHSDRSYMAPSLSGPVRSCSLPTDTRSALLPRACRMAMVPQALPIVCRMKYTDGLTVWPSARIRASSVLAHQALC
jgi:hypothetical protein